MSVLFATLILDVFISLFTWGAIISVLFENSNPDSASEIWLILRLCLLVVSIIVNYFILIIRGSGSKIYLINLFLIPLFTWIITGLFSSLIHVPENNNAADGLIMIVWFLIFYMISSGISIYASIRKKS